MATGVPPRAPVSMLVSAKLSGYLLSLLLAPVLFFAGSESLSQSQILLLLRADTQTATCQHTRHAFTLCYDDPGGGRGQTEVRVKNMTTGVMWQLLSNDFCW